MLARTLLLAAPLLWSTAHAGAYYQSPPGSPAGYAIGAPGCAGCPKGDKVALNPAVYEFLLSDQASFVRSHYAGLAKYVAAGTMGESLTPAQLVVTGDLGHIYEAQKAFVDEATGGTDVWTAAGKDTDGTVFARAVARQTAEAANQMLAKKGVAQFTWGARWKDKGGALDLPKAALCMTLVVPDEDAQTVSIHLWSNPGMITTVKKPVAVYDLSGLPGAFDAAASLDLDAVKAGAKPMEAKLGLEIVDGVIMDKK